MEAALRLHITAAVTDIALRATSRPTWRARPDSSNTIVFFLSRSECLGRVPRGVMALLPVGNRHVHPLGLLTRLRSIDGTGGGLATVIEVPWRTDQPLPDGLEEKVVTHAREVGALGPEHRVLDATVLQANPAYVVFRPNGSAAIETITGWLRSLGIDVVGRFGRWEYSSMAQALRDGHELASALELTSPTAD